MCCTSLRDLYYSQPVLHYQGVPKWTLFKAKCCLNSAHRDLSIQIVDTTSFSKEPFYLTLFSFYVFTKISMVQCLNGNWNLLQGMPLAGLYCLYGPIPCPYTEYNGVARIFFYNLNPINHAIHRDWALSTTLYTRDSRRRKIHLA